MLILVVIGKEMSDDRKSYIFQLNIASILTYAHFQIVNLDYWGFFVVILSLFIFSFYYTMFAFVFFITNITLFVSMKIIYWSYNDTMELSPRAYEKLYLVKH